jgi:peptidyl-prolyl cis-trans isomerase A (cyclophilin A)
MLRVIRMMRITVTAPHMRFFHRISVLLALVLAPGAAFAADQVLIQTSMGDITLQLDPIHAPATTANFERYAKDHHFDGTVFYRVAPGFVIQAGSYDAKGHYRQVRKPIPLEANNGLKNVRGAVAMAHGDDPNSATAEFFIDLVDDPGIDQAATDTATGFAVFGNVVSGMDVVDKIAAVPLGDDGPMKGQAPVTPVVITKVTLLP